MTPLLRLLLAIALFAACSAAMAAESAKAFRPERFLRQAAQDVAPEIEMSRLAMERAQAAEVKALAARAAGDRQKLLDELLALALAKGASVQAEPDKAGRAELRTLASRKGLNFDRRYLINEMKNLDRDLRAFHKAARDSKDAEVRAFAERQAAPMQELLDLTRKAAGIPALPAAANKAE